MGQFEGEDLLQYGMKTMVKWATPPGTPNELPEAFLSQIKSYTLDPVMLCLVNHREGIRGSALRRLRSLYTTDDLGPLYIAREEFFKNGFYAGVLVNRALYPEDELFGMDFIVSRTCLLATTIDGLRRHIAWRTNGHGKFKEEAAQDNVSGQVVCTSFSSQ